MSATHLDANFPLQGSDPASHSKKLGQDPSWIGSFYLGWSRGKPVRDHGHGTLRGYRTVAVGDTVGLACIGFVIVMSLHRFISLHALHVVAVIARVAGPWG